ncbi:hypothetical protein AVEN_150922-1 [Araneus ventricosus]|uniref:HTH CENPB-type domain-containing protein n=1 Tax=Araneus ventricosus TaxID=182803 RepID=A0A4Y2C9C3_ARAVE|nr:hypothetical protein AVEN_150922-1 [Araneus ventricosus]
MLRPCMDDLEKQYIGGQEYTHTRYAHMMKVAFEYADVNGVDGRLNNERKSAGKDWLKSFCKRYNLSVRNPEQCSVARAMGFNEVQVTRF